MCYVTTFLRYYIQVLYSNVMLYVEALYIPAIFSASPPTHCFQHKQHAWGGASKRSSALVCLPPPSSPASPFPWDACFPCNGLLPACQGSPAACSPAALPPTLTSRLAAAARAACTHTCMAILQPYLVPMRLPLSRDDCIFSCTIFTHF